MSEGREGTDRIADAIFKIADEGFIAEAKTLNEGLEAIAEALSEIAEAIRTHSFSIDDIAEKIEKR